MLNKHRHTYMCVYEHMCTHKHILYHNYCQTQVFLTYKNSLMLNLDYLLLIFPGTQVGYLEL